MKHRALASIVVGLLFGGLLGSSPHPLVAQEPSEAPILEQPPDPREELRTLDEEVLQKQRALFSARMRGDPDAIRKAEEEFQAIQKRRHGAARAVERLH